MTITTSLINHVNRHKTAYGLLCFFTLVAAANAFFIQTNAGEIREFPDVPECGQDYLHNCWCFVEHYNKQCLIDNEIAFTESNTHEVYITNTEQFMNREGFFCNVGQAFAEICGAISNNIPSLDFSAF